MKLIAFPLMMLAALSAAAGQVSRNPMVRVVTISQADLRHGNDDDLLEDTMSRLDQAAVFHPDIACLPEVFPRRAAEPVPGPVTTRLARWAQEHSSYVLFGMKTTRNGAIYNSAILIDRKGQIIGQYNKMHPTEGELKEGAIPGGTDPPVFETDFGIIGVQICFDINWYENWQRLKRKGARIVFFPSAYPAAQQLSALALVNQFYIVSSPARGSARIYDITGQSLSSSGNYQPWAAAVLPLGKRLFEMDYHAQKVREIQRKYGSRVEVVWLHDDDWFTMASLDPDITLEDIMSEFGLTPLDDYRARASAAIDKSRAAAAAKAKPAN